MEGFLEGVRDLCTRNGAVLIFDEVVTGFRVALGGAQAHYGVTPDLCCMGKGVANGMPLSFLAGKTQIMKVIDKGAFVSTTFGGERLPRICCGKLYYSPETATEFLISQVRVTRPAVRGRAAHRCRSERGAGR